MTEWEYLECKDPQKILGSLLNWPSKGSGRHPVFTQRKQNLYLASVCRSICIGLPRDASRYEEAVTMLEDFADGRANAQDLISAQNSLWNRLNGNEWRVRDHSKECQEWLAWHATYVSCQESDTTEFWGCLPQRAVARGIPLEKQTDLFRDFLGNFYQPAQWDGKYLSSASFQLAHFAYENRTEEKRLDPLTLSAPADVLIEDGCPETMRCPWKCDEGQIRYRPGWCPCSGCKGRGRVVNPLLAHLRSQRDLFRGAWSLDLVLGKS